jgi:hypothetical protein
LCCKVAPYIIYLRVTCHYGNSPNWRLFEKLEMLLRKLLIATHTIVILILTGCSSHMPYSLNFPENVEPYKVQFGNNKVVMSLTDMKRVHNGIFFLYWDFAFDKRLVVNLEDARVRYKGYGMKLNFPGDAINKDTLHIDGDENLLTVFRIPFDVKVGDTITLDLENFLRDEAGKSYTFEPIQLSSAAYIRPTKNGR